MNDAPAVPVSVQLTADPRNVSRARHLLREALTASGADELIDSATLVLSELVTNAFVHAGTPVQLSVAATAAGVRVEVEDGGAHAPVRRRYAETAGTGRGLQLVEELSDRWGVDDTSRGKRVWFELGHLDHSVATPACDPRSEGPRAAETTGVQVTLRDVPLLMHVAWQEHAASLLREYLLHALERDAEILTKHAEASDAMNLLTSQLPAPELSDEPDALMADAIEPRVTAPELVLEVPEPSVSHFATLDDLLGRAIAAARDGAFLSPPTQPEIDEMRGWLCAEVARQAAGATTATPWVARTDVRATLADQEELATTYASLAAAEEPLLATDEASIIVAASRGALELLGYEFAGQLVGRRVIVVVPSRFHQAHIAGTTLNATNGRSVLLGVQIAVPMVRADGTEVPVHIEVRPQLLDADRRVFVARFRAA